ncbi:MAG: HAD-IB family phosphatase [Chitinophagaceae bacterium]
MQTPTFIFDFDSTFIRVETLDVLAEIVSANFSEADKVKLTSQIKLLTEKAMSGQLSFSEALTQRLDLLKIKPEHLTPLQENLKEKISTSFLENKDFFSKYSQHIYIVSGGFREFIVPIASMFKIPSSHVLANEFVWDSNKTYFVQQIENHLSQDKGKCLAVASLQLNKPVYIIGDGYTDYELKKEGFANHFYLYVEHVKRDSLVSVADSCLYSLNELLELLKNEKIIS